MEWLIGLSLYAKAALAAAVTGAACLGAALYTLIRFFVRRGKPQQQHDVFLPGEKALLSKELAAKKRDWKEVEEGSHAGDGEAHGWAGRAVYVTLYRDDGADPEVIVISASNPLRILGSGYGDDAGTETRANTYRLRSKDGDPLSNLSLELCMGKNDLSGNSPGPSEEYMDEYINEYAEKEEDAEKDPEGFFIRNKGKMDVFVNFKVLSCELGKRETPVYSNCLIRAGDSSVAVLMKHV